MQLKYEYNAPKTKSRVPYTSVDTSPTGQHKPLLPVRYPQPSEGCVLRKILWQTKDGHFEGHRSWIRAHPSFHCVRFGLCAALREVQRTWKGVTLFLVNMQSKSWHLVVKQFFFLMTKNFFGGILGLYWTLCFVSHRKTLVSTEDSFTNK